MDMIEHRVRERAYFIWKGEGCVPGRAEAHWMQALAELTLEAEAPAAEASAAKAPRKAAAKVATKAVKATSKAAPKAAKARKTAGTAETVALH